jgi:hypothetical protein
VAGCCECGDEPSGSCATELVMFVKVTEIPIMCGYYAVYNITCELYNFSGLISNIFS